jgi:hypothetical protein
MPVAYKWTDIYGNNVTVADEVPDIEAASGGPSSNAGTAVSWLGIVMMLVILRILYEFAE